MGPIFAPMLQRFITSFPPTPQERRWEEVYDEVAAREMEIFNALADGSALEQVPRGGGVALGFLLSASSSPSPPLNSTWKRSTSRPSGPVPRPGSSSLSRHSLAQEGGASESVSTR